MAECAPKVETKEITQDDADQIVAEKAATWCAEALGLTAMHPSSFADGSLDPSGVKPPLGQWDKAN
eukprot:scaffold672038_cov140-Prasinocladus_malaysianus.AAC.1